MEFSEEENKHIAEIDLPTLKAALPKEQFEALAKLVGCISACVSLNEKVPQQ